MKKFLTMMVFICSAFIQSAEAQHMIKEENLSDNQNINVV